MNLLGLLVRSMVNRRLTTVLTMISLGLSVALVMGIGRIRTGAEKGFERTLSGVDLIVGARSGNINLMLATVFRLGNVTNNIKWKTFEEISAHKAVKWAVPISLGDSHKGFRVVGTSGDFFKFVKYAGGKDLEFLEGRAFSEIADGSGGAREAVVGAEVAAKLGYSVGAKIVLAHGSGEVSFHEHADKPFVVIGVLRATGTPTDRSVMISLASMGALHEGWENGVPPMHEDHDTDHDHDHEHSPDHAPTPPADITAIYLGLKNRMAVFNIQRFANEYSGEPLTAIMPAATLMEFWQTLSFFEKALAAVSSLVCISGLISMFLSLMTSLGERRREMALFRSLGAPPRFIFLLLVSETLLLALGGIVVGSVLSMGGLTLAQPYLESRMGLSLEIFQISGQELLLLGVLVAGALIVGLWPAWRAYRSSLMDGLIVKK